MDRYIDLNELWGTKSIEDQMIALARRLRDIRKKRGFTQLTFADRSGIPLGTLKIFETKGRISLKNFFRYATTLGLEDELNALFTKRELTLEEVRNDK